MFPVAVTMVGRRREPHPSIDLVHSVNRSLPVLEEQGGQKGVIPQDSFM